MLSELGTEIETFKTQHTGLRNTSQKKCRTSPLESIKNKSLALRLALENRLRKPQTAAGFVPKACETQARKTAERHQQVSSPPSGLGKPLAKASNSSRIRAKGLRNTSQKNCRTSPLESIKNNKSLALRLALENRLRKPQSSRIRANSSQKKCRTSPLESIQNKSLALRLALENRLRKPQTAAGFVPKACETQARKTAERHLWNP